MPVIDLIRHCLAYNKILKDDGVTLSSPPMATAPHLNIVEFLLSGPLESVVRSEQKKKKYIRIPYLSQFLPVVNPPQLRQDPVSASQSSVNPLQRQGRQLGNPK